MSYTRLSITTTVRSRWRPNILVSSLLVSWSKESDPPEVRDALDEYGGQTEDDRSSRIKLLAELPARKGLAALVRLTCFETSLRLSRMAALELMQQPMSPDVEIRRRHAEEVLAGLGDNDRQGSEWLRVYAEDLRSGGYSAQRWQELIQIQRAKIDTAAAHPAMRTSVLELVRVCAVRASRAGESETAIKLASDHIDMIPPTSRDLIDAVSWAIDNHLHPFVLNLRRQHQRIFSEQPLLLYGAAEALKLGGDEPQADALAEQASRISPLPTTEAERDAMPPKTARGVGSRSPRDRTKASGTRSVSLGAARIPADH